MPVAIERRLGPIGIAEKFVLSAFAVFETERPVDIQDGEIIRLDWIVLRRPSRSSPTAYLFFFRMVFKRLHGISFRTISIR